MIVYELRHIFFRSDDEVVYDPKDLGLYYSNESVRQAIQYYSTQPGFCDNPDAFSIREVNVAGSIVDDVVYEVVVYLHSADHEFEVTIELGHYGNEDAAQEKLNQYCTDNTLLINAKNLICEKMIGRCVVERREWSEGFTIEVYSTD